MIVLDVVCCDMHDILRDAVVERIQACKNKNISTPLLSTISR